LRIGAEPVANCSANFIQPVKPPGAIGQIERLSMFRFSGEAITKNRHPSSVKVSPWIVPESARQ
jgi:hypothetical protein